MTGIFRLVRRGNIDILHPDANLGDELQASRSLDHPFGDLLSRSHQQNVPFMGIAHQFVFRPFLAAAVAEFAMRLQHVSQRFDGRARLRHEKNDVLVQKTTLIQTTSSSG